MIDNTHITHTLLRNLAKLLSIPFINCFAHLWALSMSSLTKEDGDYFDFVISVVINEARRVQKAFKGSSKAASCLLELTEKVAVLPVVTRWSSNYQCVSQYSEIIFPIHSAFRHEDC